VFIFSDPSLEILVS